LRVKITYSTEINDVMEEVSNLFAFVYDKQKTLNAQINSIDALLETEDPRASLELMNKMRETIAKMDARLMDLTMILEGYNNFKKDSGGNNEIPNGGSRMDSTSDNSLPTRE
jgi:hypothetical protein